jgi:hypothetical protein
MAIATAFAAEQGFIKDVAGMEVLIDRLMAAVGALANRYL